MRWDITFRLYPWLTEGIFTAEKAFCNWRQRSHWWCFRQKPSLWLWLLRAARNPTQEHVLPSNKLIRCVSSARWARPAAEAGAGSDAAASPRSTSMRQAGNEFHYTLKSAKRGSIKPKSMQSYWSTWLHSFRSWGGTVAKWKHEWY